MLQLFYMNVAIVDRGMLYMFFKAITVGEVPTALQFSFFIKAGKAYLHMLHMLQVFQRHVASICLYVLSVFRRML
jgi:hypothetical protein